MLRELEELALNQLLVAIAQSVVKQQRKGKVTPEDGTDDKKKRKP
jgi:hypothetical protein